MSQLSVVCKRFLGLLVVAEVIILCIQITGVDDDEHVSRLRDVKGNRGKSFKKLQRMNHFINISDRHRISRHVWNITKPVTLQPAQPTYVPVLNENDIGNLSSLETYIEFEPGGGWSNDNNSYMSCQDISQISLIDVLGRGTTKESFLGRIRGEDVCVKMVTSAVTDIRSCIHRQLSSEKKCNMLANYKLVKEIGLLLQLKHHSIIKMRGFCIRSEAMTGKLADHGVVSVTELGNKVTPYRLKEMSWQSRLQAAVDIASLMDYLHRSPLGSLRIADFKQSQFIFVDGRIKLADLDDLTIEERPCRTDRDCYILDEPAKIRCTKGVCSGINTKANMLLATVELLQHLFTQPPSSVSDDTRRLIHELNEKKLTTEQLKRKVKQIVGIWQKSRSNL